MQTVDDGTICHGCASDGKVPHETTIKRNCRRFIKQIAKVAMKVSRPRQCFNVSLTRVQPLRQLWN
jgi:hypothetical protein